MPRFGKTAALLSSLTLLTTGGAGFAADPVQGLGRANRTAPMSPPQSLCDAARDARARNSPVAARLEAQCQAQPVRAIGRVNRQPPEAPGLGPTGPIITDRRPSQSADPNQPRQQVARVPDLVGLSGEAAYETLRRVGCEGRYVMLEEPDPSIAYGHIKATSPVAGQPCPEMIDMMVPRAASVVGIGALALSDVDRRDGFDLDTLRYELMTHGADIVLRARGATAHVVEGQSTYYDGFGSYVEASDGAVVTKAAFQPDALGSPATYFACEAALAKPPVELEVEHATPSYESQVAWGSTYLTGCVRTSKGAIAAILFSGIENRKKYGSFTEVKFHAAIFPRQYAITAGADARLPVQPRQRRYR